MSSAGKEFIKFRTIRGISVNYRWIMSSYCAHYHSAAEFTVALKDNCKYKVEGEEIILNTDDLLLCWPNQVHETIAIERNSTLLVHFAHGLVENNLDLITASPLMYKLHKIDSKENPELAAAIKERMFKIRDLYDNRTFFSESKCKCYVAEILVLIGEHVVKNEHDFLVADITSDVDKRHIRAALTFIDEHLTESITQTDVAEYVGLSPYYFSRLFKKYMNKNVPSYISEIRVRHALGLLADENLSITDCAFNSGFQSITAFNRIFREIVGCSPRDYRKDSLKSNKDNL